MSDTIAYLKTTMNKIHIQSITKKYTVYFQKNTQFLSELENFPLEKERFKHILQRIRNQQK